MSHCSESRWRRQPPKDTVECNAYYEQPAIAARRAIEFKAYRQFGGSAERDRDLDSGNTGVASGIRVLDEQCEIGNATRISGLLRSRLSP
jgi:hypothetical protein